MTTQLAFRNVNFNVITRNNQIWLTSKEIASALGYATSRAVTKIFNQNQDEFTAGMTDVVEVPKSGTSANLKARSRIFSLRGAHLIAMFARTEIAKEFRHWVLDILDREVSTEVIPTRNPHHGHPVPTYRYIVTLTYRDVVTGQEETFKGGCNSPGEIVQGTAKRFGLFVSEMIAMPVNAYC